MSRPRKPTNLHVIDGTHREDRHGKIAEEPKPAPVKDIAPPKWLKPDGRKVWREYAPRLYELGLLTELDVELFAQACALAAAARAFPAGSRDHVNAVGAADKILARFGFTPSDRAKIHVKPQSHDPMDELLGRRSS